MPIMSLRQYARHRGVTLSVVQTDISSKRVSTLNDGASIQKQPMRKM
jgi:hypothetical protein